jgi:hypothetical protein
LLGLRRLMMARPMDQELSRSAEAVLLRGAGLALGEVPVDGLALRAQIDTHAGLVRDAFERHVGRHIAGENA